MVCSSPGNCTAVGEFANTGTYPQAFTVSSTNGVWSEVRPVEFGSGVRFPSNESELVRVSCPSPRNCAAVGHFQDANQREQAFITTSTDGSWGAPVPVTFAAGVQNTSPTAVLDKVSCGAAGSCTAIGFFTNTSGDNEGFTVTSTNGVWGEAHPVVYATGAGSSRRPGSLKAVSCAASGLCSVGGRFTRSDVFGEIFVMSSHEAPAAPTSTFAPEMPTVRALTMAPATSVAPSTTLAPPTTVAPFTTLGPPALDVVLALPPASTPLVADESIFLGDSITVSFGGFAPSDYVQLIIASTPQVIGSGYADSNGVVALTGTLPSGLSPGAHTLAVYAPGSGVGFAQPITVALPTLPSTGSSDAYQGAWIAMWLLMAGLGAFVGARHRHS